MFWVRFTRVPNRAESTIGLPRDSVGRGGQAPIATFRHKAFSVCLEPRSSMVGETEDERLGIRHAPVYHGRTSPSLESHQCGSGIQLDAGSVVLI